MHYEKGKPRKHPEGYAVDLYRVSASGISRVRLATVYGGSEEEATERAALAARGLAAPHDPLLALEPARALAQARRAGEE